MIINISDDILKLDSLGLLDRLLVDKTTKKNIMWATDAYDSWGNQHARNDQITRDLLAGFNAGIIKTRARKELE